MARYLAIFFLLLFSLAFSLFADSLVHTVYKVNLVGIWQRNERCAVAKLHCCWLALVERRPVRQSLAVRISGLGKVNPILLNNLGNGCLVRIFFGLSKEFAVKIQNIVGMGNTATAMQSQGRGKHLRKSGRHRRCCLQDSICMPLRQTRPAWLCPSACTARA